MVDYSNKIVVFGGTGFLGKVIVNQLYKQGYANVVAIGSKTLDLKSETSTRLWLSSHADINIVIYAAATVGGINKNRNNPAVMFRDNILMGVNTIHYCQYYLKNLEKFIFIGTTCSYPENTPTPFNESNIFNGMPQITNWQYAESKRALLCMLDGYRKQYNFPAISLIPTNLFGEGDSLDGENNHVIPALIIKFLRAKNENLSSVEIWGDGSPTREFLFVNDCARGIIEAMKYYDKPDPINLGTGLEISIADLAELIKYKVGYTGEIVYNKKMPNGQLRRCLDVSRAYEEFGFYATTPLNEGLDKTIDDICERI